MIRNGIRFLISLFGIICAYFTYWVVGVPLIEGSTANFVPRSVSTPASDHHRQPDPLLNDFPSDNPWEQTSKKRLKTRHGIVYFQEYTRLENGDLEVKPFSILLHASEDIAKTGSKSKTNSDVQQTGQANSTQGSTGQDSAEQAPMLIQTADGAVLSFLESSSAGSSGGGMNFGKLDNCQLKGEVVIRRPESAPGKNDSLHIVTKNIQLSEKRILTPHGVSFRIGKHSGQGRNLNIELLSKAETKNYPNSLVQGIRSFELAQVDSIRFYPKPPDANAQLTAAKIRQLSVPLEVACDGALRMDFLSSYATLKNNVRLSRRLDAMTDQIVCEVLSVELFDRKESEAARSSAKGDSQKRTHRFARTVTAIGNPARITLQSQKVTGTATKIEFDLQSDRVTIEDPNGAVLRDTEHVIKAPHLEYRIDPHGRLGFGWANGPGFIERIDMKTKQRFRATWNDEMNLQPHDSKKAISLYGASKVEFDQLSPTGALDTRSKTNSFTANEIHVWLWEKEVIEPDALTPIRQNPQSPVQSDPNSKKKWTWIVSQMLASGRVTMDLEQLTGQTREIQIFWPPPSTNNLEPQKLNNKFGPNQKLAGTKNRSSLEQDSSETATPLTVNAMKLVAHLDMKHRLEKMKLTGNIRIVKPGTLKNPDAVTLTGNELTAIPTANPKLFRMSLEGQPAQIEHSGMKLDGSKMTFDQFENLIHIDGGGKMNMANLKLTEKMRRRLGQNNSKSPPEAIVSWEKDMYFDGRQIVFNQNALITAIRKTPKGETLKIAAVADKLKIDLSQSVNFSESIKPNDSKKIEIQDVHLVGRVDITNITLNADNRQTSIDKIHAPELSFNYKTGAIVSNGAGWVQSKRLTEDSAERRTNARVRRDLKPLNLIKIHYTQSLRGNIIKKQFAVNKGVRAIYSPISSWDEERDINSQSFEETDMLMFCDQMTLNQWQPRGEPKPISEIIAQGNTHVEGANFKVDAPRVVYDSNSDVVILQGDSQQNAKIQYRQKSGSPWQTAQARTVRYSKGSGAVNVEKIDSIKFSTSQPLRNN